MGRRMWFWLGSRGEENGLFPFLTSFFSSRQQSGQDPRGGSRRDLKDTLGLLRADLKGGRGGLLASMERAPAV